MAIATSLFATHPALLGRTHPFSMARRSRNEPTPTYPSSQFIKGSHFTQYPISKVTDRIPSLPSWSWVGWDGELLMETFSVHGKHTPAKVTVSLELKNGQLLGWDDFQRRYEELNDYTCFSHAIHLSAPVAKAYAKRDKDGNFQCLFRLTNGF
ncbi:hypothetical protein BU16DRAFT_527945 [Lophium mytilinum]|uniref:Uncharacterized protein n=1 Tax=Lophium mytilinum TaxID=390894 RepID=A0A6A6QMX5_9PEZI|nr:hypothetical protein BU16DRAFT_527945 [Lophium mytilinum]